MEWSGRIGHFVIYPCILTMVFEVIARYGFNRSTIWAHETSTFLYGIFSVLLGGYVVLKGSHIAVDVISSRFAPRTRAILELFLSLFFFSFLFVLLWQSTLSLQAAITGSIHTQSNWSPPLWPIRLALCLGASLLILSGISKFIKDLYTASGKKLEL